MMNARGKWASARVAARLGVGMAVAVVGGACASTGTTFRSGVGDAFLEHPPYYAGRDPGPVAGAYRTGHLPVVYQRGASHSPIFDPSWGEPMTELLGEMNAYLDSLGVSVRLVEGGQVSAVSHAGSRVPPDVQFGCETDPGGPGDECAMGDDEALGRGHQATRLAVGRPSPEWAAWMKELMDAGGTDAALVITLEVGQYPLRQKGLRGTKIVELGTSHVAQFPWLTSLETPVAVLQLTGALVGPDGRAIRIGAEGLTARRTSMLVSSIGGQALMSDDDVEHLRTARRDDLPGHPLVWQVGLRTLVGGLTGARLHDQGDYR